MLTIPSLILNVRHQRYLCSLYLPFSNTKIYIFIQQEHDFALFFVFLQKISQKLTFYLWQKN